MPRHNSSFSDIFFYGFPGGLNKISMCNFLPFVTVLLIFAKNNSQLHSLMSGSSHIQSVLIGIEYRNCCQTLDVYLLFAILLGQIESKLNNKLINYKMVRP